MTEPQIRADERARCIRVIEHKIGVHKTRERENRDKHGNVVYNASNREPIYDAELRGLEMAKKAIEELEG